MVVNVCMIDLGFRLRSSSDSQQKGLAFFIDPLHLHMEGRKPARRVVTLGKALPLPKGRGTPEEWKLPKKGHLVGRFGPVVEVLAVCNFSRLLARPRHDDEPDPPVAANRFLNF